MPPGQQINEVSLLTNERTGELDASWTKTKREPGPTIAPPPGFLLDKITTGTFAGEQRVQWESYSPAKAQQWAAMLAAMKDATAEYKGLADPVKCETLVDTRLLNIIPIGDPHIGMLAWSKETGTDFDSNIAREDLLRALRMVFDRSPDAETCLIAQLGDFFHAEDDKQVTPTAGHKLDVDTRAGRITRLGFMLMRSAIDLALKKHRRVVVANLRGNHDPYKSVGLNLYLEGVYEREPRLTILDNNNPYIFYEHGQCLFGLHHGDGAKPEALPGIMAEWQGGAPWGRCPIRKWFTGHVHSERSKDFPGVSWQSCRTLAPSDYWAWHKGYRSEQSLECHTYDIEDGLVSRQPVTLRLVRKDIARGVRS